MNNLLSARCHHHQRRIASSSTGEWVSESSSHDALDDTLAALPIMAGKEAAVFFLAFRASKLPRGCGTVPCLYWRCGSEGEGEHQSKFVKVQSTSDFGPRHMHDPYAHARPAAYSPSHLQPSIIFTTRVIPSPFVCRQFAERGCIYIMVIQ
jgi:hypothetical protein